MPTDNFGGPAEPAVRVPLPSPLRWAIAAGVCLVLVVAAFAGGWVIGKNAPKVSGTVFGNVPVAAAPADWTAWKYPGSEVKGLAAGGTSGFGTARVDSAHTVQLVTPDPIEQVLGFYGGLLGQPGMANPTAASTGSAVRAVPRGGQEVCSWAETVVTRPGVKGKVINYRTSNYDLVVVVTRADAEKHTHVLVSYMPNP